jgi:hypothetical protein
MLRLEKEAEPSSFVKDLSTSLWATLSSQELEELDLEPSDLARFSYVLRKTRIREKIDEGIEKELLNGNLNSKPNWHSGKNRNRAFEAKSQGNSAFGSGNNEEALEYYSSAIAWMPVDENKGKSRSDPGILDMLTLL